MSRFAAISQPRTVQTPEGVTLAGDAVQASLDGRGTVSPIGPNGPETAPRTVKVLNLLQVLEALRQADLDLAR